MVSSIRAQSASFNTMPVAGYRASEACSMASRSMSIEVGLAIVIGAAYAVAWVMMPLRFWPVPLPFRIWASSTRPRPYRISASTSPTRRGASSIACRVSLAKWAIVRTAAVAFVHT
ncbi:hypothetical protein D3C87_1553390 [compost metagenome]